MLDKSNNKGLYISQSLFLFILIALLEVISKKIFMIYFQNITNELFIYLFIGMQRLIDLFIIFLMILIWKYNLNIIGLSISKMKKGVLYGIYWSLSFGILGSLIIISLNLLLIYAKKSPLPINPLDLFNCRKWNIFIINFNRIILIIILIGCFLGPVVEDILFIGVLFNKIKEKLYIPFAVIISALFFALCHGRLSIASLIQFTGGILFALSFKYSESLLSPMIIHTSGNLALFFILT